MRLTSSHALLLLAAGLIAGLAAFTGLADESPTTVARLHAEREKRVGPVATGTRSDEAQPRAVARRREVRVRWADGAAVVGAEVWIGDRRAETDTRGRFTVADEAATTLSIQPRCWRTPWHGRLTTDIVLPATIDVEFSARLAPRLAALLTRLDHSGPVFRITGQDVVAKHARVPYRSRMQAALLGAGRTLARRDVLGITRARPLRVEFAVDTRRLVHGRIVDHEGTPLPFAAWSLGGEYRESSATGEFVFGLEADAPVRVHAAHLGKTVQSELLQPGTMDAEVRIDFRGSSRIRVVRSGTPVLHYELTRSSRLGHPDVPTLPRHENGTMWSPVPTGGDPAALFLGWSERGAFREIPIRLPAGTTAIDLDLMAVPEFGRLRIEVDRNRHQRVRIVREGGAAFESELRANEGFGEFTFASLPVGTYDLTLRDGASGRTLRSTVLRVDPGTNHVDLRSTPSL